MLGARRAYWALATRIISGTRCRTAFATSGARIARWSAPARRRRIRSAFRYHGPPMSTVTVAATQMACSWDRDANIARAEKLIRAAAAKGARVVLIQELFESP